MRYLKIYVENTFSGIDSIQPRSVHLQMKRNETKKPIHRESEKFVYIERLYSVLWFFCFGFCVRFFRANSVLTDSTYTQY